MQENDLMQLLSSLAEIEKLLFDNACKEEAAVIHQTAMILLGLSSFYFREVSKQEEPLNEVNIIH